MTTNPNPIPTAALATHAHEDVSNKYAFIPTTAVIEALADDGWRVYSGSQKQVRNPSREGYQTHLLRFVRNDIQGDDLTKQFSMVGRFSHDTSASIVLMAGVIVFACENGIIVSEGEIGKMRFVHRNLDLEYVISGARELIAKVPTLQEKIEHWKQIQCPDWVQAEFANAAALARWGSTRVPGSQEQAARVLLEARRHSDMGDSLWSVFNRIQENLIKGTQYWTRGSGYRRVARKTRAVTGVDQEVDLNQVLWGLAIRIEQGQRLLMYLEDGSPTLAV